MSDHRSTPPSRVTLEDLLRWKRAERPSPEFWTEFERELRQKQLAALVEKKPWWHGLAAAYGRFGWLRLPLGATAALALTFLAIRYYSQSGDGNRMAPGDNPSEQTATLAAVRSLDTARPVTAAAGAGHRVSGEEAAAGIARSASLAAEAPQMAARPVAQLSPHAFENPARSADLTPSARSIAVNLATAAVIEPELVDAVALTRGFEDRAMPAVRPFHAAEVLPTAAAVTEPRRARLLAFLGSAGTYAPELSAPEHAKRSVTRYLAQDGWERSINRLEAGGNRLSIKF
jgi:hypothetical protein